MSNPAVITLAELQGGLAGLDRLQIEDNIGEAIHLHIGPVRLDFTITDFLDLAEGMKKALDATGRFSPYTAEQFDPMFLLTCGSLLAHLEGIDIEERYIDDLRCIVYRSRRLGIYTVKPVKQTPAYRFLATGDEKFLCYEQKSYLGMNNKERLVQVVANIENFGYPREGRHIILFKGQSIVRDGQHRLAALRHRYGNMKIPVMVFRFSPKATTHLKPWQPYIGIVFRLGRICGSRMNNRLKKINKFFKSPP
ncbi:hypothetical protein [Desulfosudis oleivorans]|uniref:Uncharacterized protein n=1 Tax=Desulfosudis oleivorans (strain DSM 6200 / JCM 39069 / Hxd3) TaxID=96561 RepID=A8ZU27_DESOH|nr:hypothetical protein [Desulfosudis oleivorans]ABW66339.1 hypothetical protein Dole_0529 [Desulfosudis oleivorans Hxd3]